MEYYSSEDVAKIRKEIRKLRKKPLLWNQKYELFIPAFKRSAPEDFRTNKRFIYETRKLLSELKLTINLDTLNDQIK